MRPLHAATGKEDNGHNEDKVHELEQGINDFLAHAVEQVGNRPEHVSVDSRADNAQRHG
jgi:hypothetical protein